MKNLLIYIHPSKRFGEEEKTAIKIKIDNSLDLGWKKEDILLVTNFDYKYNNVKAFVVKGENYCTFCPTASKINAIIDLFGQKLIGSHGIEEDRIYWFHDLDAYQLNYIPESELELDGTDMLLPDFGRKPKWSTGSFFFKNSSRDIFNWVKNIMDIYKIDEEGAFCILTGQDYYDWSSLKWIKGHTPEDTPGIKNINERIKKANITYNFHSFNVRSNYAAALKPIRVAHFHFIERPVNPMNPKPDQIDFFLRGINKLGVQIVPERLVKIFNQHGI